MSTSSNQKYSLKNLFKTVGLGFVLGCCAPINTVIAVEIIEQDSQGNINQRNIGSYKSNQYGQTSSQGTIEKRMRPLQPYTTLKLEIPASLTYHETGNPRVEIIASQDVIKRLSFVYNGSRLTISGRGLTSTSAVKLKLYGNNLQRVFINSPAEVSLNDISVSDFLLSVRSAAEVDVQGAARSCQINVDGANDVDLSELKCQAVTVASQGSSDIIVSASRSVKGRVQGAGDIDVLGKPAKRDIKAMGAYDIVYR